MWIPLAPRAGLVPLLFASAAAAVLSLAYAPAAAADKPALASPLFGAPGEVTIQVFAPEAKTLEVKGDWIAKARQPLTRDDEGIWRHTFGGLAAGVYQYALVIDGVQTVDPLNPWIKDGVVFGHQSLFEIATDPGMPFALRQVPHGTVHHHTYWSKTLEGWRDVVVYTPPGYERGRQRYPVLYLLHGSGEVPTGWTHIGLAHRIADNRIAEGSAVPLIIVMPNGHTLPPHTFRARRDENTTRFVADFLSDLIPFVASTYRTKAGAQHRAVAGLSMGGAQALVVGLERPREFPWVGAFSWGPLRVGTDSIAALNVGEITRHNRLLWLTCGRDDFVYEGALATVSQLRGRGLAPAWVETDGAHDWLVWRRALATFLPQLFRIPPRTGTTTRGRPALPAAE